MNFLDNNVFTDFMASVDNFIAKYYVLVGILFIASIFFIFVLKGFQWNFKAMFNVFRTPGVKKRKWNLANFKALFSKPKKKEKKEKKKIGISGFQALMVSTASRIGNGNIAGVAGAIVVGGPGALFWMWVMAILAMGIAFVEGVMAQYYKRKDGNTFYGGVPFYIAGRSGKRLLKIFAIIYSVAAIFTFGLSYVGFQSNAIASSFNDVVSPFSSSLSLEEHKSWIFKLISGIILAVLLLIITIKGIKSIGKFSSIVMPLMGIFYLLIAVTIIFMNVTDTWKVWTLIFRNAFGFKEIFAGIGGFTIARAIQQGFARGVFSNEAGIGSASFAAASSNSKHPVQQGLLQSLSTFLDTIIICTASGFIILYSGIIENSGVLDQYKNGGKNPVVLVQESISAEFGGEAAKWFVFISLFLFGLTTVIGLYYYSESSLKFITKKKIFQHFLKALMIGFIIVSAVLKANIVWSIIAVLTPILVSINVSFLFLHTKKIKFLLKDYRDYSKGIKNQVEDYKVLVEKQNPVKFTFPYEKDLLKKEIIKEIPIKKTLSKSKPNDINKKIKK